MSPATLVEELDGIRAAVKRERRSQVDTFVKVKRSLEAAGEITERVGELIAPAGEGK